MELYVHARYEIRTCDNPAISVPLWSLQEADRQIFLYK